MTIQQIVYELERLKRRVNSLQSAGGGNVTQTDLSNAISDVIGTAGSALNTLGELSDALGDNADFAASVTTSLSGKQATLSGTGFVKSTAGTISYDTATYQPLDSDLTTWAGITPAAGIATFLATPSSANLKTAITDETGASGSLVFADSPTFTTQIVSPAILTSSVAVNGNFGANGTTSTAFSSTISTSTFLFGGASNVQYRTHFSGSTSTVLTANASASNVIFAAAPSTEGTSGTHAWNNNVSIIGQTITNGTATTTNAATLYIESAPTGATNMYALHVAAGAANFTGGLRTAATGTSANFYVPLSDGATTGVSTAELLFNSASTVSFRAAMRGSTATTIGIGDSYGSLIIGNQVYTQPASGTNAMVANLVVRPITHISGASTTTNTATLLVDGPSTGGSSNFALRVNSGDSLFAGNVYATTIATSSTVAAANLYVSSTGFTVTNSSTAGLLYNGASTVSARVVLNGTGAGTLGNGTSYAGTIVGSGNLFTTGSGSDQPWASALVVRATTWTIGTAAVTNYANVFVDVTSASTATNKYGIYSMSKIGFDATITAGGTTGNRTIDKPTGTVNIAAGNTAVTVTNNIVTANSIVYAVLRTNDANDTKIKSVVPAASSFVINLSTAPAAEVSIGFIVFN